MWRDCWSTEPPSSSSRGGFHERLAVSPETRRILDEKDIPVHIAQTEEAADIYDGLRETERVGALIHSTC